MDMRPNNKILLLDNDPVCLRNVINFSELVELYPNLVPISKRIPLDKVTRS
jgi:hypothetical protein